MENKKHQTETEKLRSEFQNLVMENEQLKMENARLEGKLEAFYWYVGIEKPTPNNLKVIFRKVN